MFSITIQLMKRSAKMLIPAGIAIMIGTLFISSTFLFANTLNDSMRTMLTAQFGDANYALNSDDPYTSARVSDLHLDRIRQVDGVEGVRVDTGVTAQVNNGRDGHSSTFAIPVADNDRLMPISLKQGEWPDKQGEIAIPQDMAERLGIVVGDKITIDNAGNAVTGSSGTVLDEHVVGLTQDARGAYSSYGGASALSDADAAAMFGLDSLDDVPASTIYLLISSPAGTSSGQIVDSINRDLPGKWKVISVDAYADAQMKAMSGGNTSIITTFLLVFGALAMFVAALVIGNTFQVLVAQRRRTLALLRTIGAQKTQLYGSVLFEAVLLGLISSALGMAGAFALMAALHAGGVQFGGLAFQVIATPEVFWAPVLFGVTVTVLASMGSARSATRVTSLEALRPAEFADDKRGGMFRLLFSALLVAVGGGVTAYSVFLTWQMQQGHHTAIDDGATILLMAMGGVALFFLGLVLSAVRWLPMILHGTGAVVAHTGPAATIAAANIRKNPRRVAATGAALLIGVTLVSCVGTGAASAKQTMAATLDSKYSVDLQITGPQLTQSMVDRIAKVKGVAATELVDTGIVRWEQPDGKASDDPVVAQVVGLTEHQAKRVLNKDLGVPINDDAIIMMDVMAGRDNPIKNGSTVTVSFADANSTKTLKTVKLTAYKQAFRPSSDYEGMALVSSSLLQDQRLAGAVSQQIWVKSDGSVSPADLFTSVQDAVSSEAGVTVTGSIAVRVQWEQIVDTMMMLLVALLAVAVLIALVGVANTLSLSVIERTKESATLRAIGMTRGQLRGSLAVEALLIALGSGVVGLIIGTLFGWVGAYVVFIGSGMEQVQFPVEWGMCAAILGVSAVAALGASVLPVRRAVKTAPVVALAEA